MNRDQLIERLVDDVLGGELLSRAGYRRRARTGADWIDEEGVEIWLDGVDLMNVILGGYPLEALQDRLRKRLAEKVREWLNGPGADYVDERLADIEEDAKADAAEARADARQP